MLPLPPLTRGRRSTKAPRSTEASRQVWERASTLATKGGVEPFREWVEPSREAPTTPATLGPLYATRCRGGAGGALPLDANSAPSLPAAGHACKEDDCLLAAGWSASLRLPADKSLRLPIDDLRPPNDDPPAPISHQPNHPTSLGLILDVSPSTVTDSTDPTVRGEVTYKPDPAGRTASHGSGMVAFPQIRLRGRAAAASARRHYILRDSVCVCVCERGTESESGMMCVCCQVI